MCYRNKPEKRYVFQRPRFQPGGVQSKLLQMTLPRAILGGIFLETFLEIFMENIIFALISAKW